MVAINITEQAVWLAYRWKKWGFKNIKKIRLYRCRSSQLWNKILNVNIVLRHDIDNSLLIFVRNSENSGVDNTF